VLRMAETEAGRLAARAGNFSVAMESFERALCASPTDDVGVAGTRHHYAEALVALGRADEAGIYIEAALRDGASLGADKRTEMLTTASKVKRLTGDAEAAVALAESAADLLLTSLDPHHLSRGLALAELARGQLACGQHQAAKESFQHALVILTDRLPTGDPRIEAAARDAESF
jgi:tetratricopeptide (TPR) repeat protein